MSVGRAAIAACAIALACAANARAETKLLGILPIPEETDFRSQVIERQPTEAWPFAIDRGLLMCVPVLGAPAVYFTSEDADDTRVAIVSVDPIEMWLNRLNGSDRLIAMEGTLDELTRAMIPYLEAGRRLCKLDKGTQVGPGET